MYLNSFFNLVNKFNILLKIEQQFLFDLTRSFLINLSFFIFLYTRKTILKQASRVNPMIEKLLIS